nr:hypothetical protein [Burkholderiaceae bacterium]
MPRRHALALVLLGFVLASTGPAARGAAAAPTATATPAAATLHDAPSDRSAGAATSADRPASDSDRGNTIV